MMRFVVAVSFIFLLTLSCGKKPVTSIPSEIIQPDSLVNIVADLHIAQAATIYPAQGDSLKYNADSLRASVFKLHDLSKAYFDSSMLWYEQHPEILEKVYVRVLDTLNYKQGQAALTD